MFSANKHDSIAQYVYIHWLRDTVKASFDAMLPSITINNITYMIDQRICVPRTQNQMKRPKFHWKLIVEFNLKFIRDFERSDKPHRSSPIDENFKLLCAVCACVCVCVRQSNFGWDAKVRYVGG